MFISSKTLKLKKLPKPLSLREFYNKRNKVLIIRDRRGLGDIFSMRMIFEDFHRIMPDIQIVFACHNEYHKIAGHPYIDTIIDTANLNKDDYLISYDLSNCCIIYESKMGKRIDKHRAEIWAEHCGVQLTTHDMHLSFHFEEEEKTIKSLNKDNLPTVLFCPKAFDKLRSLQDYHVIDIVNYLREKNFFIYSTNLERISILEELGVPNFIGYKNWYGFVCVADYVITVDTSTFHIAGGLKKPMVGIFTHIDGRMRGKYFDFILVQYDGWGNCPCYTYNTCDHPNCKSKDYFTAKPCITELSSDKIIEGISKMVKKWHI